jgi:class 3 adenylate cyclase
MTGKNARFAASAFAAFVTLYLALHFLQAPRLGPHYDFLAKLRPYLKTGRPVEKDQDASDEVSQSIPGDQAAAREILLIESGSETENLIAASTVFALIMTLVEMDAASLLVETPVLGVSSGRTLGEAELVYRFDDEFSIVESNIKNLFDGIRLGSVTPRDAARYVDDVIRLTEQGKNRLLSATVQGDEEQAAQLESASAVLGSVYMPGDLLVDVIRSGAPSPINRLYVPVYSRPPPDPDGKVRRIAPVLSTGDGQEYEYAAYSALKKRYSKAELRTTEDGFTLEFGPKDPNDEGGGQTFVLDSGAALIFGLPPGGGEAFRKIELSLFLEYTETERILYRLLDEAPTLARYADISIENYPPFLYEQARQLRETLLENPDAELKERWKYLRASYYDSLDKFFDETGGAGTKIASSFRELEEQENLDDAGRVRLAVLLNEQLEMFNTANELYRDLADRREKLKAELNSSFCILGPVSREAELSAMFANSIISGNYTTPANIKQTLFSSIVIILFLLFALCRMGPVLSLCFSVSVTALTLAGFSYSFILSGLWIDPLIPGVSLAAGAFVSSLYAVSMKKHAEIRLRCVCGAIAPELYLKSIARSGGLIDGKETRCKAAIVHLRCPGLAALENGGDPQKSAAALKQFRKELSAALIKAGAVITGCEGETLSAAFGSPLERLAANRFKKRRNTDPENVVMKAVGMVNSLPVSNSSAAALHIGIDYGECVFSFTPVAGYTATGSAVFRSRLLSTLAQNSNVRALISKTAGDEIDAGLLVRAPETAAPDGTAAELYYQLTAS